MAGGIRELMLTCSCHVYVEGKFHEESGAPVAQWVKLWPADLAVPGLSPARGENFSTINGVPLHTAFLFDLPFVLI